MEIKMLIKIKAGHKTRGFLGHLFFDFLENILGPIQGWVASQELLCKFFALQKSKISSQMY